MNIYFLADDVHMLCAKRSITDISINKFKINFGKFLFIQPDNIKKQVRNIENLENKLANARVAIVFNKTCLNEN